MFLMFDKSGWFNEILRPFFGTIDYVIFTLTKWITEGIFNIADLAVNSNVINAIYNRIYVILAIFMIFKLSFSFIQYIVSPDKMSDKKQGATQIIGRTIAMLCLLIFLPVLFFEPITLTSGNSGTVLNLLQSSIMKTIPKLILGSAAGKDTVSNGKEYGEYMAVMMIRSVYFPATCDADNQDTYDASIDCDTVEGENVTNLNDFKDSLIETEGDYYKYHYLWPLSTVVGIVMIVILLGMCIDVAIRVFKLIVLQMMAPIPVMTLIDPKSASQGAFASWLKTFISTYIDLFIKLALLFLVLYLIKAISSSDNGLFTDNSSWGSITGMSKLFVRVFIIIGLLKFAKDAPKFVKDAMGIKDSGGGGGFMGKALAGLGGAAAGFAGGVAAGGGLTGGLSAAASGFGAGSANAGSGKKANIFGQSRDEMAKSLGKTPGGLKGKAQQKALQHQVAKKSGLTSDSLEKSKNDWIEKQNAADMMKMKYERGEDPEHIDAAAVQNAMTEASAAQSKYEKANKMADSVGLNQGFMDKNKRHGAVYRAGVRASTTAPGQAVSSTAHNINNNIRTGITNKVKERGEKKYGDNYTTIVDDRSAVRNAKDVYNESLAGGFGAPDKTPKAAKDDLKDFKTILKQDKDDYRT